MDSSLEDDEATSASCAAYASAPCRDIVPTLEVKSFCKPIDKEDAQASSCAAELGEMTKEVSDVCIASRH